MTDGTKALVERLSDMELAARDAERGFAPSYGDEDAATLREAIAALSRPLPGVVEGMEPSELAVEAGMAAWFDEESPTLTNESVVGKIYGAMAAIDLAPRVAAGYTRGVEDAAKVVDNNDDEGSGFGSYIRKILLPKAPATEDATSETEHEP
jgi:hypothetical protein